MLKPCHVYYDYRAMSKLNQSFRCLKWNAQCHFIFHHWCWPPYIVIPFCIMTRDALIQTLLLSDQEIHLLHQYLFLSAVKRIPRKHCYHMYKSMIGILYFCEPAENPRQENIRNTEVECCFNCDFTLSLNVVNLLFAFVCVFFYFYFQYLTKV